MRRRALLAGSAAVLPWALAGCRQGGDADLDGGPLRLAIDLWPGYLPAVLADQLGWMAAAGVQLKVIFPGDTDQMLADFTAGRFDVIGASLGDLITITRGRLAAHVIAVTDESVGGDVVLARRGLELARTPGELTLGTNLGGFGEVFVREFLRQRGLEHRRWVWVNVDAAEVPQLLASGKLDVGHTWEPYASRAVEGGAQPLFSSADTPGLVADVLVATNATLRRRPRVLRAFMAQWFRAVDWWQAHPQEAVRLIARAARIEPERVSLKGMRLLDLAHNRALLGAGPDAPVPGLAAVVQRYSDHFVAQGAVARPLDARGLLHPELLP